MTTDATVSPPQPGAGTGSVSAQQMALLPETSYKSRLNEYAQKSALPLPVYITKNDGLIHAPRFRSTVTIDGSSFRSDQTFKRAKAAEQDAARRALEMLPQKITKRKVHEEGGSMSNLTSTSAKAILNEFAVKISVPMPEYSTKLDDGIDPFFVSDVSFCGKKYRGLGSSKKEAERKAAQVIIETILGNSLSRAVMSHIINSKVSLRDALQQNPVISPTPYGNLLACSADQPQTDPIGDSVQFLLDGTIGKKRRNKKNGEEVLSKKQRPDEKEESQGCEQSKQPKEEPNSQDIQAKKSSAEDSV